MILTYDRTDEPTLLERPSRKQPEPMRQCARVPPAPPEERADSTKRLVLLLRLRSALPVFL